MGAIVIRTRFDEGTESAEVATSGYTSWHVSYYIWLWSWRCVNASFNNHYRGGQFYTQLETRRTRGNHRLVASNWISHKAASSTQRHHGNRTQTISDSAYLIIVQLFMPVIAMSPNHDVLHELTSWQIYKVLFDQTCPDDHNTFEYLYSKTVQSEHCIHFIQCFSWMSLEC